MEDTSKIQQAIQEFLKEEGLENLEAYEINFREKPDFTAVNKENNLGPQACVLVWNPILKKMVCS